MRRPPLSHDGICPDVAVCCSRWPPMITSNRGDQQKPFSCLSDASEVNYFLSNTSSRLLSLVDWTTAHPRAQANKQSQSTIAPQQENNFLKSSPMRAFKLIVCAYIASILLASTFSIVASAQVVIVDDSSYNSPVQEVPTYSQTPFGRLEDEQQQQTTDLPQIFRHHSSRLNNHHADHYHQQHMHHNHRHKNLHRRNIHQQNMNRFHNKNTQQQLGQNTADGTTDPPLAERQIDYDDDSGIDNVLKSNRFWEQRIFENNNNNDINTADKTKANHLLNIIDDGDEFSATLDEEDDQDLNDVVDDQYSANHQKKRLNKDGLSSLFHDHHHQQHHEHHSNNQIHDHNHHHHHRHHTSPPSTTHSPIEFLNNNFNNDENQNLMNQRRQKSPYAQLQTDSRAGIPRSRSHSHQHHLKHHANNIDIDNEFPLNQPIKQHRPNQQVPEQAPIVVSSSDNSYVSASPIVIDINEIISTTATTTGTSQQQSSGESIGSSSFKLESDQFKDSTRFGNYRRAPVVVNSIRDRQVHHATIDDNNDINNYESSEQHSEGHFIGGGFSTVNHDDKLYAMKADDQFMRQQQELTKPIVDVKQSTVSKNDHYQQSFDSDSSMDSERGYKNDNGVTLSLKRSDSDDQAIKSSYSRIVQHHGNEIPFGAKRYWHEPHIANIQIEQENPHSLNRGSTNSAIIAILFGIGATGMLIMIVGHKMRSIKRRVAYKGRRRSLVPDTDFLINTIPI